MRTTEPIGHYNCTLMGAEGMLALACTNRTGAYLPVSLEETNRAEGFSSR